MAAKFDFDCILHQDNDGKHTSKLCKEALKEANINWVFQYFRFEIIKLKIKFGWYFLSQVLKILTQIKTISKQV